MLLVGGPLAQSAERAADTSGLLLQQLRRGREFEPLTDQLTIFLCPVFFFRN